MKLGTLLKEYNPNPGFEGWVTNDDMVLAVDISENQDASADDYAVVQMGIAGLDSQMNPVTVDKQYLRSGNSTMKTGTQRTFKVTGDRYIGDEFQDYAFSHKIKYGVGNAVVVKYVFFNVLNGVGESGTASIIPNSDGSGNAGESAGIDIDLKKIGAMPEEYNYVPEGTLGVINILSVASSTPGSTTVSATSSLPSGMNAFYKTDSIVVLPKYDDIVSSWDPFTSGSDYPATNGDDFAVVYVDSDNKVKYAGSVKAVVA